MRVGTIAWMIPIVPSTADNEITSTELEKGSDTVLSFQSYSLGIMIHGNISSLDIQPEPTRDLHHFPDDQT